MVLLNTSLSEGSERSGWKMVSRIFPKIELGDFFALFTDPFFRYDIKIEWVDWQASREIIEISTFRNPFGTRKFPTWFLFLAHTSFVCQSTHPISPIRKDRIQNWFWAPIPPPPLHPTLVDDLSEIRQNYRQENMFYTGKRIWGIENWKS